MFLTIEIKINQMRKINAIYSELARESATVAYIFGRLKGRQRSGKALEWTEMGWAADGPCWHGARGAIDRLTRNRASYKIG